MVQPATASAKRGDTHWSWPGRATSVLRTEDKDLLNQQALAATNGPSQ